MTWALLVVDGQHAAISQPVLGRIQQLERAFRQTGERVYQVESMAVDQLAPLSPVGGTLYRCGTDAFSGSGLQRHLQDAGISCLVICGSGSDSAIDASVRSALYRGFDVIVASDAHQAYPRGSLSAQVIAEHHNQLLAELVIPGRVLEVLPSDEIIDIVRDEPVLAQAVGW
ncbi:isochorismatase family protein [Chitinimonas viridis]|uniref:Isochorismatase family protein n=1 Tax=Chitinimonas viridis TaxID=664880 RepID=A0ABT8AZI5_9NEIS|nr:isochorismatase family protein [Chitinimonas viridis]MDN3575256.1 isochorismatase family protein [Chitinimonas viridis]